MKFTKMKFEKPLSGCGVVTLGKSTFSFDLEHKDAKGNADTTHFSLGHDLLPDDLPETFRLKNGKAYWFNIRADGSAINNVRPATGRFKVVCSGIAKNVETGEFTVIEKGGDFGKYWQYVAELEVVEGPNKGIKYPLYLPLASENKKTGEPQLKYHADAEGNFSPMGDPDKSANIRRLFDWIICSGLVNITMVWKEEYDSDSQPLLKALDKAVRKLSVEFEMVAKNGYPDYMASLEVEDDAADDEDEVEEEETPKAKAKKVVEEEDEEDQPKAKAKKVVDEDDDEPEDDDDTDEPVKRPSFSKLRK